MPRYFSQIDRRGRSGSALVEGALVLTVLVFVLLGIVDVGQVLVAHQALVERVRAGARYAVVHQYNPTAIRNVVLYNTPDPAAGSAAMLGLTEEMVQVNLVSADTPEARVEIRIVDYPFRFLTPMLRGLYRTNRIRITLPAEGLGAAGIGNHHRGRRDRRGNPLRLPPAASAARLWAAAGAPQGKT